MRRLRIGSPFSADEDLVFPNLAGQPLDKNNLRRRHLRPVAEEVGAGWAGFHTFRHTFASLHIARGTTLVQLSGLLGHHSPAFTMRVYAHLIPGDEPEPLDLATDLAPSPLSELASVA